MAGGSSFTLAVTGANFVASSVVRWNGVSRPTTYVRSTQLQASISAADIAVINLEAPLIDGCPEEAGETFTFCGQPGFTAALAEAGVDVATLENNHITNYGPDGVTETEQHLDDAGDAFHVDGDVDFHGESC